MAVAIAKEDYQRKAAVLDNAIPGVPLDDSPQDKSIKDKKRKPTYNFSRGARLINY